MSGVNVLKCVNVSKLKQPDVCETLTGRLDRLDFDGTWENVRDRDYSVGAEVLGFRVKNHKAWFDDNDLVTRQLLKLKCALHEQLMSQSFFNQPAIEKISKEHEAILQRELRRIINEWWTNISLEIQ